MSVPIHNADFDYYQDASSTNNDASNESYENSRDTSDYHRIVTTNANGGSANGATTVTQTLTLVKGGSKQRLPTLVHKLKECTETFKKLSDTEAISKQETDVKEQLNHIRRDFLDCIDSMEQCVLSTRPTSDDPDYQEKISAYCEMIKLTMTLMEKLQGTLDHIFSEYFKFFKDLSDAVEQNINTEQMVADFKEKINKTDDAWQPHFDAVDKWKCKLDNLTNAVFHHNVQSPQKPPTHLSLKKFFSGFSCTSCGIENIDGTRFECTVCVEYNLCKACFNAEEESLEHSKDHAMTTIRIPVKKDLIMEKFEDARSSLEVGLEKMEDNIIQNDLLNQVASANEEQANELQKQIRQQFQNMRDNLNNKVDELEHAFNAALIGKNQQQRNAFMKGAGEALRSLQDIFSKLLRKLDLVIVNICQWIRERSREILERIREVFRSLREEIFRQ